MCESLVHGADSRLKLEMAAPDDSLPQQPGVLFQPAFGLKVIGEHCCHLPPEARRVVHLPEMHQFMEDDVIAHARRRLDQPPIERNRAAAGTRAPPGALIAHGHAPDGQLMARRELHHARRQFRFPRS